MIPAAGALLLCLLSFPVRAAGNEDETSVVSEDITIRGKRPPGPPVAPPPVKPEKPVSDEVIRSLDLYKANYKKSAPKIHLEGGPKRLAKPFPEPPYLEFSPVLLKASYARWRFEVFSGNDAVWKTQGEGRVTERLAWGGTDGQGRMLVRVGALYNFRFTAVQDGGDELALASDPVQVSSMLYREEMGEVHLEVANALLFEGGGASLREGALPYLAELAVHMRKLNPKKNPYRVTLYQEQPNSKPAKDRAASLKYFLARALVVNPTRISVTILGISDRGEVTACVLPPDGGDRMLRAH